jgi:hypothetical protein
MDWMTTINGRQIELPEFWTDRSFYQKSRIIKSLYHARYRKHVRLIAYYASHCCNTAAWRK